MSGSALVCFASWSNCERRQANGDIEWAAGKAMNGLTLAAQVAGVAWTEVGPGSR